MRRTNTKHYTNLAAITLHAEANKSDPFASRRMALALHKRHDIAKEVGAESERIIASRKSDIRHKGPSFHNDAIFALGELYADLTAAASRRASKKSRYRQHAMEGRDVGAKTARYAA